MEYALPTQGEQSAFAVSSSPDMPPTVDIDPDLVNQRSLRGGTRRRAPILQFVPQPSTRKVFRMMRRRVITAVMIAGMTSVALAGTSAAEGAAGVDMRAGSCSSGRVVRGNQEGSGSNCFHAEYPGERFRAVAFCASRGGPYTVFGPDRLVGSGQVSIAWCRPGDRVTGGDTQDRG